MMMIKDNHYVAIVADVAVDGARRIEQERSSKTTTIQWNKRRKGSSGSELLFVAKPLELGLSFSALDSSIL